jgi:hypothetical protein
MNLGNILKPSNPDFGYAECMNFNESLSPSNRKTGWALFLDFIQRYPVKEKAQNIIHTIQKEKV